MNLILKSLKTTRFLVHIFFKAHKNKSVYLKHANIHKSFKNLFLTKTPLIPVDLSTSACNCRRWTDRKPPSSTLGGVISPSNNTGKCSWWPCGRRCIFASSPSSCDWWPAGSKSARRRSWVGRSASARAWRSRRSSSTCASSEPLLLRRTSVSTAWGRLSARGKKTILISYMRPLVVNCVFVELNIFLRTCKCSFKSVHKGHIC